jgi:hypothetical protein
MGLETQLRESMLSHADAAPAGAGLLEGVRVRDRRFRRRRWMLLNAGLAVVLVATAVPLLGGGRQQDPGDTLPRPGLAPADFEMPYFPYEPTWMPSGAGEFKVGYYFQRGVTAETQVRGGDVAISVSDLPIDSQGVVGDQETQTLVNNHPARQLVGPFPVNGTRVELSWEQDDKWIMVWASGSVTAEDAKRVGEGLRPGRIEIRTNIKLELAPEGWVVGRAGSSVGPRLTGSGTVRYYELCLTKPETVHDDFRYLCVDVDEEDDWSGPPTDPASRKIAVNGGEGWLTPTATAGPTLEFRISQWTVYIEAGDGPQLSDDDLIRFAEGISLVEE